MTTETITPAVILGALLSVLVEWVPGIGTWWNGLTPNKKRGIMAFGIALITVGSMLYSCRYKAVCPADIWAAIWEALLIALLTAAANQATYAILVRRD